MISGSNAPKQTLDLFICRHNNLDGSGVKCGSAGSTADSGDNQEQMVNPICKQTLQGTVDKYIKYTPHGDRQGKPEKAENS